MVLFYIIWYSTSMFFGLMMLLVVCLMMDVTSCGSMAGSACAAFRAVGPCIRSWFVWSYAPAVNDRGEMATGR